MAQLADIQPGAQIHLKVVHQPTSAGAAKTLARLLNKDPKMVRENRELKTILKRRFAPITWGGRPFSGRMVKLHRHRGDLGEEGTIRASVDVLRDLGSVARFVEITPA